MRLPAGVGGIRALWDGMEYSGEANGQSTSQSSWYSKYLDTIYSAKGFVELYGWFEVRCQCQVSEDRIGREGTVVLRVVSTSFLPEVDIEPPNSSTLFSSSFDMFSSS